MSATVIPFEPGAALARIVSVSNGWRVDCRGPYGVRRYYFHSAGEAAEFAIMLRDDGNWQMRFSTDAEVVRVLIAELDQ